MGFGVSTWGLEPEPGVLVQLRTNMPGSLALPSRVLTAPDVLILTPPNSPPALQMSQQRLREVKASA